MNLKEKKESLLQFMDDQYERIKDHVEEIEDALTEALLELTQEEGDN